MPSAGFNTSGKTEETALVMAGTTDEVDVLGGDETEMVRRICTASLSYLQIHQLGRSIFTD